MVISYHTEVAKIRVFVLLLRIYPATPHLRSLNALGYTTQPVGPSFVSQYLYLPARPLIDLVVTVQPAIAS